jgi:hypothetical protein
MSFSSWRRFLPPIPGVLKWFIPAHELPYNLIDRQLTDFFINIIRREICFATGHCKLTEKQRSGREHSTLNRDIMTDMKNEIKNLENWRIRQPRAMKQTPMPTSFSGQRMLLMLGPSSTNYCLELGSNSLYSGGLRWPKSGRFFPLHFGYIAVDMVYM